MRINSVSNNIPATKKIQQNQRPRAVYVNSNYVSQGINPTFSGNGWFEAGKKAVSSLLEPKTQKELRIAKEQITKQFQDMWGGSFEYDGFFKIRINALEDKINEETLPFVKQLMTRIKEGYHSSTETSFNLEKIDDLVKIYNENPQSRTIMQQAINAQANGKPRFDLSDLSHEGIFGYNYNSSRPGLNEYIGKMIDAKALNGGPRFLGKAFSEMEKNYSPEKFQVLDLILHQTVKTEDKVNYKKLAKLIKESNVTTFKKKAQEAVVKGKRQYLIDASGFGISEILEHYTPEKLTALTMVLPKVADVEQVIKFLKYYNHSKHSYLLKGLKLVENDKLSMNKLINSLRFVGKD